MSSAVPVAAQPRSLSWADFGALWRSTVGRDPEGVWDDAIARLPDDALATFTAAVDDLDESAIEDVRRLGAKAYEWAVREGRRLDAMKREVQAMNAKARAQGIASHISLAMDAAKTWAELKVRYDDVAAPIFAGVVDLSDDQLAPPPVLPGGVTAVNGFTEVGALPAAVAVSIGAVAIMVGAICWAYVSRQKTQQITLDNAAHELRVKNGLPSMAPYETRDDGDGDFSIGAVVGGAAALILLGGGVYLATRLAAPSNR